MSFRASSIKCRVYTRNGTQLVGSTAVQLSFNAQGTLTPSTLYNTDPTKSGVGTITLKNADGTSTDLLAAGAIQSGEIAALVQMRDKVLPQAQTQLDEFASQMSQALSNQTTTGTAVTVGTQNGFTLDTTALQNGNTIHLTYTDALNVQHNISIVRVDDPSVLPLPNTTTADPTDQVIGVELCRRNSVYLFGDQPTQYRARRDRPAILKSERKYAAGSQQRRRHHHRQFAVAERDDVIVDQRQPAAAGLYGRYRRSIPVPSPPTGRKSWAMPSASPSTARCSPIRAISWHFPPRPPTAAGNSTRPTYLANQMTQATYCFRRRPGSVRRRNR